MDDDVLDRECEENVENGKPVVRIFSPATEGKMSRDIETSYLVKNVNIINMIRLTVSLVKIRDNEETNIDVSTPLTEDKYH